MGMLYDLTGEMLELQMAIESAESDEDAAEIAELLQDAIGRLRDSADGLARLTRNLSMRCDAYRAEEQRLAKSRRALESSMERIKGALMGAMNASGMQRVQTSIGVWSLRLNPPSVCIDDETLIPAEYLEPQPPKIDKQAIKQAYKLTGEEIPGTHIERAQGLQFK